MITDNVVMWVTRLSVVDWVYSMTQTLWATPLKTLNQLREESEVFEVCKKQTSVSHSSTESEVISLDAGLRMDGIPALDLLDVVTEVLHSSPKNTQQAVRDHCRKRKGL